MFVAMCSSWITRTTRTSRVASKSGDDSVRSSWGKLFETSSWTIASIDMENNSNSSYGFGDNGMKCISRPGWIECGKVI